MKSMISALLMAAMLLRFGAIFPAPAAEKQASVSLGEDGKLQYTPDDRGNTIPDFSRCGYMGGGVKIPDARVLMTLKPAKNGSDDTARIQKALDDLARKGPDRSGIRGALLLKRGTYRIKGTLKIAASGVILRGEGQGKDGTILFAAGTQKRDLISIAGGLSIQEVKGSRIKIADAYVPWGAMSFKLESTRGLSVGNEIIVYRPSPANWIHDLKMDRIPPRRGGQKSKQWQPGEYDLRFERVITAIKNGQITLNAPVVNAMEDKYGGGFVYRYTQKGRIAQVGLEHLRIVSEYQKGKEKSDEAHAWCSVKLRGVTNAWVRNVTSVHFSHAVQVDYGTTFVTVQDCASLKPVSLITGGRRYPFSYGQCQFCLIQRCYTEDARHAQAVGHRVCGPNVYLDCLNEKTHADSGPHHRWSVGILYDNLKGGGFNAQDRAWLGSGHGWTGAQQVFWNCVGGSFCIQKPPTAQNYAFGCVGKKKSCFGFNRGRTLGHYESHGKHVEPRSLYLKQLEDRLGKQAVENVTTEAQRKGNIYEKLKAELSH